MKERIRPVLVMNKLDRCFVELQQTPEEIYQQLVKTIDNVNSIITTFKDQVLGDCTLSPETGTVAFCAAKMGWGFTIQQFARMYAQQTKMSQDKWEKKLWGDNFYDPDKKVWTTQSISDSGQVLERGFCQFILKPLQQIFQACLEKNQKEIIRLLKKLELLPPPTDQKKEWTEDEEVVAFKKFFVEEGDHDKDKEKEGKELLRIMLKRWIPASNAVLEMVALKLPSPVKAQNYRTDILYTGPQDNEVAKSIRECNPEGPLVMFISKMIPNKQNTRFY